MDFMVGIFKLAREGECGDQEIRREAVIELRLLVSQVALSRMLAGPDHIVRCWCDCGG